MYADLADKREKNKKAPKNTMNKGYYNQFCLFYLTEPTTQTGE